MMAATLPLAAAPPATSPTPAPAHARVVRATDPQAVKLQTPDVNRVRKMFNAALMEYAGIKDVGGAWKKIILPANFVGIKIYTPPGHVMSSRSAVVETIIDGLELAGIPRSHVILFDRYAPKMEAAGYPPGQRADGVTILPSVPNAGYDPKPEISVPIPGKLIWGDLEFDPNHTDEDNQISNKSHFTRVLTQQVDKVINVAVPTTDPALGLYGCQLNASLSLIDNFRRLQRPSYTREDSLTELFSNPLIQKKFALHVLDSLIAQYAGGPGFDPNYCWNPGTIYLSRDAVALDALALQQINLQRPRAELEPIKDQSAYIQAAADANLGIADPSKIDIVDVKP